MLVFVLSLVTIATIIDAGFIHHNDKATSYQSFSLHHHHAVPTYIKEEHQQFLEHPVSKGTTQAEVEVHHGHKHDPGYALSDIQNDHALPLTHSNGYEVPEGHGDLSLEGGHAIQYQLPEGHDYHQHLQEGALSEGQQLEQAQEYQQIEQDGGGHQQGYGNFLELANAALAQAYQHQQQEHS